jgi:hypothetical protein
MCRSEAAVRIKRSARGQQELARLGIDQDDLAAFEAGPERIMPIIRIAKSLDVRPD